MGYPTTTAVPRTTKLIVPEIAVRIANTIPNEIGATTNAKIVLELKVRSPLATARTFHTSVVNG